MSGEGAHPEPGNHHGDNGMTNPGFDDPLRLTDTGPDGKDQKKDWPKEANKMLEDFLSNCPGAYGGNEQSSSRGQATEHSDPSVSYLIVYLF